MTGITALEADLARFYENRPVVLLGHPLSAYARHVAALRRMGSRPPFVVAADTGHGTEPEGIAGHRLIEPGARDVGSLIAAPTAELREALTGYDRDGTAVVIAETADAPRRLAGRLVADGAAPQGEAFPDHAALDAFWARLGVKRLPSVVVAAEPREIAQAHDSLDLGHGTLLRTERGLPALRAGGPVHRVRVPGQIATAARRLACTARQVRVMPFVPGTPCGISGFVLPDGPVVLRPHEEIVLEQRGELHSAGCSGFYEPSADEREDLTGLAVMVGTHLHERLGYRGAFQLSGLLVGGRFLPFELGLRTGAGHALLEGAWPSLSTALLHAALSAGHEPRLERAAVQGVLTSGGTGSAVIAVETPAPPAGHQTRTAGVRTMWLAREADGVHAAAAGERSDACLVHTRVGDTGKLLLLAGPSLAAAGGQQGSLLGPSVAQACQLGSDEWHIGLEVRSAW